MARPKSKMNNVSGEVIQENILLENPEGLPDERGFVVAKTVPPMRRVQFLNGRDNGVALEFHYHSKTHPLKHYKIYHGQELDLPEEIIDHLESCRESIYGHRKGYDGHPETYVSGYKYIFQCRTVKPGSKLRNAA